MRILRVAQAVYPETYGGGAYHVHAMSRDQARSGHDVTVLTVGEGPTRDDRSGYRLIRRRPTVSFLGNEISPGVWTELSDADSYDVVHAHSHLYFSTNVAALRRRLGQTPLAITNHGLYSQTVSERIFRAYLRTAGRWTFNSADLIFCYTADDERRLRDLGVGSPIEVVPNGIDTDRFTPSGPTSELVDHDGVVVLFVGRLVAGKRPEDAIDTIASLRPAIDAKLYFCGDGPLHEELQVRARALGVETSVEFLGRVDYDEMPRIYRSADVVLLPSRAEGFPRTVLEAYASKVPVVSSRLGYLDSIGCAPGDPVSVGDVEGYAKEVERAVAEGEQWGVRLRDTVVERFQWADTVDGTTEALETLR